MLLVTEPAGGTFHGVQILNGYHFSINPIWPETVFALFLQPARLRRYLALSRSEQLRRKAAQYRTRLELEEKTHSHLLRLQHLSGPGEQLESFRKELSQTNMQQVGDEEGGVSAQIKELEEQQNVRREERGRVETLIQQLAGEDESSSLRVDRNALVEDLREYARDWSRLKLADALLSRAREKFQKERQPGVIQHAQTFFTSVTGERYRKLYAPIEEQTIIVEDGNGAPKHPSELSRGTKEQLYLALRFGLIREFGEHAELLPVIVDEILVNFDPDRAKRAAEAFVELSQTNQVLVFTCHPEMVKIFTSSFSDVQVIEIASNSLTPMTARNQL